MVKAKDFPAEATRAGGTEKGGLNGDTVITLAKYVMDQRAEKAKEALALKQQLDTLQEQMQFVARKLADLTSGSTRVVVGFNTWVGYGPLYIAKEKGFFDEENLAVELQRMEGTGERRAVVRQAARRPCAGR